MFFHFLSRYGNIFRFFESYWDWWVSTKWQHMIKSTRQRVPLRREQYRPSLELPFQVNANWSQKFWGVILPFVAVAVIVKFAFLANIISVSVEPSELAVNWRGGWLSALTVCCGTAASHCAWVWKRKSDRKIKSEKEIKRQGVVE